MQITLNNRNETFEENVLTVKELLKLKNFTYKMLVVKVNNQLITKDQYDTFVIKEADDVIVLHLVSGG